MYASVCTDCLFVCVVCWLNVCVFDTVTITTSATLYLCAKLCVFMCVLHHDKRIPYVAYINGQ